MVELRMVVAGFEHVECLDDVLRGIGIKGYEFEV